MIKNKNGWGLREMLFICAIIFFCVILAAVMINRLYQSISPNILDSEKNTSTSYEQVEKNLASAARIYYNRQKEEDISLIISEDLISEGYLKESKLTVKDDVCSGYVIVADNTFTPYISCENYETEGY